ncbi:MAG: hypothetical protein K0Q51_762 [Rickettsiaceae bacterium]|jgi:hypothetical protein|nr:hypothetical protein [Rickettsiaceae bacterium]
MNNFEQINKEVSLGIKKAQAEISSFIEQTIKAKKMMPSDLNIHSLDSKSTLINEVNELN